MNSPIKRKTIANGLQVKQGLPPAQPAYVSVLDPTWSDADCTAITCYVQFAGTAGYVPFNATPTDPEPHGREIYARCVAGDFGPIAPYVPPSDQELAAQARAARDALLRASDWSQLPDVPRATRALWAEYRQVLRDLPEQAGWPRQIYWPQPPQ